MFSLTFLLVLSVVAFLLTFHRLIAVVCFILISLLVVYGLMFREPHRKLEAEYKDGLHVVSPIDGYIVRIQTNFIMDDNLYYVLKINSDLFSTNANFVPVSGVIKEIRFSDITVVKKNNKKAKKESRYYKILTKYGDSIIFTKDANTKEIISSVQGFVGSEVEAGQKFGFMKFGNSAQIFIPHNFKIEVNKGDKVTAGLTIIARGVHEVSED